MDPWTRAPLPGLRERLTGLPVGRPPWRGVRWLANSAWTLAQARVTGEVVHPGVDPARFPPSEPPAWRGRLLAAGRVEHAKGTDVAVAAARAADCAITVCGDGPLALAVPRRKASPEDMAAVYAEHDAVLHLVRWDEPWGLVPLEAMAVGRPVVATITGGGAEFLRDGENCLAVPRGDAGAAAAAVRRLAADPGLRARLVAGGRATASRFTRAGHDAAVVGALEAAAGRV